MNAKSKYLEACSTIYTKLKDSTLAPARLKRAASEIKLIADFYKVSRVNAVILCVIIQESWLEGEVELDTVARHFNLVNSQFAGVRQALDELAEAGLIEKCNQEFKRHKRRIAPLGNTMDALLRGDKSVLKPKEMNDVADFFKEYVRLQEIRKNGGINHTQFIGQVVQMCHSTKKLPMARHFSLLQLPPEELVMLVYLTMAAYNGEDLVDVTEVVKEVTADRIDHFNWCERFRVGEMKLIKDELVEFTLYDLGIDTSISLTQVASEKLFSKSKDTRMAIFRPAFTHYLTPESIAPVELIFDNDLQSQLTAITKSVMPKNFARLTKKLYEQNLKGGFTILLHGQPGTGKTESVYQLARETGRAVLRLEISKIKEMWVGESEKNLKKVFNEYRRAKRTHTHAPILLFNEADAIFSKRRHVGSSVDQMENSLQNILLQELEEFDGILIATTNLTQNLDTAFERRFLFKLEFKIPTKATREKLLARNFKGVDLCELGDIASAYSFTGSNIQNVKRKMLLDGLLHGRDRVGLLKSMFERECMGMHVGNRIGFRY